MPVPVWLPFSRKARSVLLHANSVSSGIDHHQINISGQWRFLPRKSTTPALLIFFIVMDTCCKPPASTNAYQNRGRCLEYHPRFLQPAWLWGPTRLAAEHILEQKPENQGTFVSKPNIYSPRSNWNETKATGGLHEEQQHKKKVDGCSWVELGSNSHVFHTTEN